MVKVNLKKMKVKESYSRKLDYRSINTVLFNKIGAELLPDDMF